MKSGFKLGLIGLAVSSAISITFGILELRKTRRMHQADIDLIVAGIKAKNTKPRKVKEETLAEVK